MAKNFGVLVFTGYTNGVNRIEKFGRLNITSTVERAGNLLLQKQTSFNLLELCELIELSLLNFKDKYNIELSITRKQIKSAVNRSSFEQFEPESYRKINRNIPTKWVTNWK